jgi:hypothetical protein
MYLGGRLVFRADEEGNEHGPPDLRRSRAAGLLTQGPGRSVRRRGGLRDDDEETPDAAAHRCDHPWQVLPRRSDAGPIVQGRRRSAWIAATAAAAGLQASPTRCYSCRRVPPRLARLTEAPRGWRALARCG